MKYFWTILGLILLCGRVSAEMRIWRDQQGNQFEGDYVRVVFGKVMLQNPQGEKIYIPLKELASADTKYLSTVYVPTMEITVRTRSRAKPPTDADLPDDKSTIVTAEVTIRTKEKVESSSLRAEVYLVGAEVATADYRIVKKAGGPLTFTTENAYQTTFSLEMESREYMEFNFQDRGTLYEGYLVLVFDKTDELIEYKSALSWLDKGKIEAFRKFRVNAFFNKDCRRRPVPRPVYSEERVGTF